MPDPYLEQLFGQQPTVDRTEPAIDPEIRDLYEQDRTLPGWIDLLDPEKSAIGAALRTLGRGGQAIRNLLAGKPGSAALQIGEIPLEIVDALIPFWDAIPAITDEDDYTEGSDLLGLEPGTTGATVADVGIGVLTDPLSWIGVGAVRSGLAKGAKAAAGRARAESLLSGIRKGQAAALGRKADEILPDSRVADELGAEIRSGEGVRRTLDLHVPFGPRLGTLVGERGADRVAAAGRAIGGLIPQPVKELGGRLGHQVRSTMGWLNPVPALGVAAQQARHGVASKAEELANRGLSEIMAGTDSTMQKAMAEAGHGVFRDADGSYVSLGNDLDRRIARAAERHNVDADALRTKMEGLDAQMKLLWEDLVERGGVSPMRRWRNAADEEVDAIAVHSAWRSELRRLKRGLKKARNERDRRAVRSRILGARLAESQIGRSSDVKRVNKVIDRIYDTDESLTEFDVGIRKMKEILIGERGVARANQRAGKKARRLSDRAEVMLARAESKVAQAKKLMGDIDSEEALKSKQVQDAWQLYGKAADLELEAEQIMAELIQVQPKQTRDLITKALGREVSAKIRRGRYAGRRQELERVLGRSASRGDEMMTRQAASDIAVDEAKRSVRDTLESLRQNRHFDEWAKREGYRLTSKTQGLENYLPRYYTGKILEESASEIDGASPQVRAAAGDSPLFDVGEAVGSGQFLQARKIDTPDDLAEWLNRQRGLAERAGTEPLELEMDLGRSIGRRIAGQGKVLEKSHVARALLGDQAVLTDPATQKGVRVIMDHLRANDPDSWKVMQNVFASPRRGDFVRMLAGVNNRVFKPAVTMGLFFPRFAFNIRNALSGAWQRASVEGGRAGLVQAARTPRVLVGAVADGLSEIGIMKGRKGALRDALEMVDDVSRINAGNLTQMERAFQQIAQRATGGSKRRAQWLRDAVEDGILDGFVSTERLIGLGKGLGRSRWSKFASWPAAITRGVESRMRLGTYLDHRAAGKSRRAALKTTQDSFLDYSYLRGGSEYAAARQFIPFLAFTAQSIPQQLKLIARRPEVAVAMSKLRQDGRPEEPVQPWIGEQSSIPLPGRDREGNRQYITSLGLPFEALDFIPNVSGSFAQAGRDVEREIIGSSTPLVKSAIAQVTRRDPFFGTPVGTYDKAPEVFQAIGAPERGDFGRAYQNLRQTGLIAPLDVPIQETSRWLDDRRGLGSKTLRFLTGANIASSDPDLASVQILQDRLERVPGARVHRTYYGDDPMIDRLTRAIRAAKDRREREAADVE